MTEPGVDPGVYVTVHTLDDELDELNVHVEVANVPPLPPSLHDTDPPGVEGAEAVSVTVDVNASELPTVTDDELGDTPVLVESEEPPEPDGTKRSLIAAADASFSPRLPSPNMFSTVASTE